MPSLASIAGIYSFQLFGVDDRLDPDRDDHRRRLDRRDDGICYIGIELSARTQQLLLPIGDRDARRCSRSSRSQGLRERARGSVKPSLSWFNPFAISQFQRARRRHPARDLHLLGLGLRGQRQRGDRERRRGLRQGGGRLDVHPARHLRLRRDGGAGVRRARSSLIDNQSDVFAPLAKDVLGSPLDKLLIIAVLTSASASTQTTILPATRSALSMARHKALPDSFGEVHPRYQTPSISTIWMGVRLDRSCSSFLEATSQNLIADAFTSLGLTIAFYYGITGYACTWFYRRHLFKSLKNFLYLAFLPLLGAGILTWVFVKASSTTRPRTAATRSRSSGSARRSSSRRS